MEGQGGREAMRIFTHGTDNGNATVTAMVLVMVLSSVYIAFIVRIDAAERYAAEYRARVVAAIEESNREILSRYDFR
jgi:type II secretory pathway component PulK